jgi:hypothetical protein
MMHAMAKKRRPWGHPDCFIQANERTKERKNEAQFLRLDVAGEVKVILPSSLPTTVLSSLLRNLCPQYLPFFGFRESEQSPTKA